MVKSTRWMRKRRGTRSAHIAIECHNEGCEIAIGGGGGCKGCGGGFCAKCVSKEMEFCSDECAQAAGARRECPVDFSAAVASELDSLHALGNDDQIVDGLTTAITEYVLHNKDSLPNMYLLHKCGQYICESTDGVGCPTLLSVFGRNVALELVAEKKEWPLSIDCVGSILLKHVPPIADLFFDAGFDTIAVDTL